jgi:hypothetical protein
VLAHYDAALRLHPPYPLPAGVRGERDGPVLRVVGRFRGFVQSGALADVADSDLAAVVAAQRDFFAARGELVEWRTYAHDGPRLPAALAAAGFTVEQVGTVLVGSADALGGLAADVPGAALRSDADLDAIAAMVQSVWGGDWSWLPGELGARRAVAPDDVAVYAVVADGAPVSAAWVSVYPGTGFAVLTGGTTVPPWRGRGCYRALVAVRARFAGERGASYLTVDASADSAPILRRLGFTALTEVTSFVWRPAT